MYVNILLRLIKKYFFVAVFLYYEDPRGNIPKAVWSWAAKVCKTFYIKRKNLNRRVFFKL